MVIKELHGSSHAERVVRTVLVVDVVESVRLIENHEDDAISRWRGLVDHVEKKVLPNYGGRLVKSLGDGMLLDFPNVQPAINAAFAIQRASHGANAGVPSDRQMLLRIGAQVGELISDEHDVYGRGVNLAARLTTLAGPGEIVVSAGVRDQITPFLDADIEDLGECYLKHVQKPVRAYRLGPPGPRPVIEPGAAAEMHPTIAVIPFTARGNDPEHQVLGEVLADEMISALSRTSELNVISRLSTTTFRGRGAELNEVSAHLNANYVLSGFYRVAGSNLTVDAELAETRSGRVAWTKNFKCRLSSVLEGERDVIDRIVTDVSAAIMAQELQRTQFQALPTLESYTLLMGAIALMHRLSLQDFDRARNMLQALIDRVPRSAIAQAWMGKWHVLRVQQGWSGDVASEARRALDCTRRALDEDPNCSLALAIDGFAHTNLLKNLDVGQERYEHAIRVNPNDSLAWLLKGTLHAFKGEGKQAVAGTQRALRLSPLDPHRYFYDSLAAAAAVSASQHERAIALAQRSLRANRTHTSTFRALAIAQWQLGQQAEARKTIAELMRLEPGLTVAKWLERSPSSGYETGRLWSVVLREAGVPG